MVSLQPRVTIVVTQRESFVHTQRSLERLYASTRIPFSLIYIDGGSPRRTHAYLERAAEDFGFRYVRFERFLAPNEARNAGLALVESDLVAFVENDVLVADGWLERLIEALDEEGAAVAGPLTTFLSPEYSVVHSVGGAMRFDATPAGRFYHNIQRVKAVPLTTVQPLERTTVDFLEFHCFLARTETVRACGGFDEALRTCCEFDDFFLSVGAAGGTVVNEPASVVHHMLPLPPPRGLGDLRFLLARWKPADNAASTRHFRQKWNVRDDDPYLLGLEAWCDGRPRSILASTRTYKALLAVKHGFKPAVLTRG